MKRILSEKVDKHKRNKVYNDKYYTPSSLAEYVVGTTKKIVGDSEISEFLEPSAGGGVFLDFFDKPYLAYDIEPEDNRINKQDFLTLEIEYKKNRCIIGNPPYGIKNTLAVQFYKKSVQLGDYIAFILPSSQYGNYNQMYEFDLIHSELIDNKGFTDLDKRINLTFNIYKRNPDGLNPKPNYKLKDVIIKEARKGTKNSVTDDYDIGICSFGWSLGKETEFVGQYANEFYLYIKNEEYKNKIVDLIKNTNWKDVVQHMTGIEKINQWQVYKYIKETFPELN